MKGTVKMVAKTEKDTNEISVDVEIALHDVNAYDKAQLIKGLAMGLDISSTEMVLVITELAKLVADDDFTKLDALVKFLCIGEEGSSYGLVH